MSSYGTLRGSIQSLGIVYSCVARGRIILAYSANCQGNFSEVIPGVLAVIPSSIDDRMTYTSGDYMFHYVTEREIIILCITDDEFERSRAFLFLEEAKQKFFNTHGDSHNRFPPFSLNSTFGEYLRQSMEVYSDSSFMNMDHSENINRIQLETINVRNFREHDQSGRLEQLELLESDDNISVRSIEAHIEGGKKKIMHFWRRNLKVAVTVIILIIVLLIVITAITVIVLAEKADKDK